MTPVWSRGCTSGHRGGLESGSRRAPDRVAEPCRPIRRRQCPSSTRRVHWTVPGRIGGCAHEMTCTRTASERIWRSRALRPPSETTSTLRPRMPSSSSPRWSRSKSELPGATRTRRSLSLWSGSSPRAAEPKTANDRPRWRSTAASTSSRCSRTRSDRCPAATPRRWAPPDPLSNRRRSGQGRGGRGEGLRVRSAAFGAPPRWACRRREQTGLGTADDPLDRRSAPGQFRLFATRASMRSTSR